jgi:hypothetical protein
LIFLKRKTKKEEKIEIKRNKNKKEIENKKKPVV